MKAWYFAPPKRRLRFNDKRLIRAGVTHTVEGSPRTCSHGLHGSLQVMDALQYAETSILYRVELSGEMDKGSDKIAAQSRKYIKRYNIESILFKFARKQALINIKKIRPYTSKEEYSVIIKWLNTGDKKLRSAAESAALSVVESAVESVAWSAAGSVVGSAAESAAWSAAWSAKSAWSVVESAAESAAWSAQEKMLLKMITEKYGEIE